MNTENPIYDQALQVLTEILDDELMAKLALTRLNPGDIISFGEPYELLHLINAVDLEIVNVLKQLR